MKKKLIATHGLRVTFMMARLNVKPQTYRSSEFIDVTLACNDDKFSLAHKVILWASSSFFSENSNIPLFFFSDHTK